ncbi:MAG: aromatic amino acid transport family protein [Candidatus Endonucleobacter bathymodioli]|uniref:Aromatic amino acid transport family protein n=1 Tax=Candidatus Endonucleibacter bathymodioli TaxID=539814 RepID=A0AA90SM01_9GAMM|nr:aromatic amino acid transport family protein [Candidatus Endonucleobacter bathymodioli]
MSQHIPHPTSVEKSSSTWQKRDGQWLLTLFGTAVGAGILFLPINAGIGGIWPLIAMTIVIGPMTFWSHQGLTRFCLSSSNINANITDTVTEHFGHKAGCLLTLGYFLSIFPILIVYGIGITNTTTSLIVCQLNMNSPPRAVLSFFLVGGLVTVMTCGEQIILKVCSAIVYPLIAILAGTSLYLIPQWSTAQFEVTPTVSGFISTMFLTIPVLVFSFNHSPAISSFASAYRRELGDGAEVQASYTLKRTSILLVGFTMLFVYSCVLALPPSELIAAKAANLSILSIFAESTSNSVFGWLVQIVALVAISSSFFGHYIGTCEGLNGLIIQLIKQKNPKAKINTKLVNRCTMTFITISVWAVSYLNLSIINIIETIASPILAAILFIMPVYAIRKVPSMQKYQSATNIFTLLMGIIAITGFIVSKLL